MKMFHGSISRAKAFILCAFIIVTLCAVCAYVENAHVNRLYGGTAVVIDTNKTTNLLTLQDIAGNIYQVKNCKDFAVNDIVTCIFDSRDTARVDDDNIINITYSGYNADSIEYIDFISWMGR